MQTTPAAANPATRLLSGGQILRLSLLWFGLQFFWSSNQVIVVPDKVHQFVPIEHYAMYRASMDSIGSLLVILTQLVVGFLSDHACSRLGRRRPFIISGTALGLIAIALFMFAPNYWALFGAYMLIQVSLNIAQVPFTSLLPDLVPPEQHSRAGAQMGVNHVTGNIAGYIVVVAMVLLFSEQKEAGLRYFLLPAYLLVLAVCALVCIFGVREQACEPRQIEAGSRRLPGPFGSVIAWPERLGGLWRAIGASYVGLGLLGMPVLLWLMLSRFAYYLGFSTFVDWIKDFSRVNLDGVAWLAGLGLGPQFAGMLAPLVALCFLLGGVVGNVLSAPLSQRFSKLSVTACGLALTVTMVVPLIFTQSVWPALALGVLIGIGYGAFLAADWALGCSLMPKEKAGVFMSVWTISGMIPATLGPLVYGPLRDGVFNAQRAALGDQGAEALAHQLIFALVAVYLLGALLLLLKVRWFMKRRMQPAGNPA